MKAFFDERSDNDMTFFGNIVYLRPWSVICKRSGRKWHYTGANKQYFWKKVMLFPYLNNVSLKVSDCHHMTVLICVTDTCMLTKTVKINQLEGIVYVIPSPDIPEQPFVKFAYRCFFTFSQRTSPLLFHPLFLALHPNWMNA